MPNQPRRGRGRNYHLTAPLGFTSSEIGTLVAALDELRERLFDVIADMPPGALSFVPTDGRNSASMLVCHMAAAEAVWIARATGATIPDDLAADLAPGRRSDDDQLPPSSSSAGALVALCRRVRDEITVPALSGIDDAGRPTPDAGPLGTLREVLMHLVWHWTYHTGQVGLLRRLAGPRYKWTYA